MLKAIADVLDERRRQIDVEGFTADHDDRYENDELVLAAVSYALYTTFPDDIPPRQWPFPLEWWKPKDERRDLVRAAALIVARIEQIDRQASASAKRSA
ncbi:hypothetical protein [Rhizobium sp. CNPSo 4039]|uniref:hypothetical protein n=1 Tax=Rhizobium sp. CNPSo 4039 TaxID=3021409 RepID=UPI00254EF6BA|nr:hypothetical protein [Rhizobium sp. CNPSo 4039]MDK4713018.1 hypothetical protein [Rhizobium sp. CNPSo 4039]